MNCGVWLSQVPRNGSVGRTGLTRVQVVGPDVRESTQAQEEHFLPPLSPAAPSIAASSHAGVAMMRSSVSDDLFGIALIIL